MSGRRKGEKEKMEERKECRTKGNQGRQGRPAGFSRNWRKGSKQEYKEMRGRKEGAWKTGGACVPSGLR